MKISVVDTGYVGLLLAMFLAQKNDVKPLDAVEQKVTLLSNHQL